MSLRLGLPAAVLAACGCVVAPAAAAGTAAPAGGSVPARTGTARTSSVQPQLQNVLLPLTAAHDYDRASEPRRHLHSSDDYAQDAAMRRCRRAVGAVRHLPLRYYRISCAPVLERGNSTGYTSLVGGNTYRSSEDIVIGTFLAPAALDRLIKHEAVHGFTIEHRSVRYALERWAHPERSDAELTGDVMDDPAPYPRSPSEVYAAAWARCHGGGPDPVIEDDRMSCADVERITRATLGARSATTR